MNVSNVFKLASVILFFNGLMSLFMTDMFFEMAAFTVNESLHTFGQFTGVTFLAMGIIAWKTVDLAGDNLKSFGKVYALTQLMWVDGLPDDVNVNNNIHINNNNNHIYYNHRKHTHNPIHHHDHNNHHQRIQPLWHSRFLGPRAES